MKRILSPILFTVILAVSIAGIAYAGQNNGDMTSQRQEYNSEVRKKLENMDESRFKTKRRELKMMLDSQKQRSPRDEQYRVHPGQSQKDNTRSTRGNIGSNEQNDSGFYSY